MSKWINHKINEFMGTDFTVRETEILTLGTMCTALVALIFTMYTAIFPNIQGGDKDDIRSKINQQQQRIFCKTRQSAVSC